MNRLLAMITLCIASYFLFTITRHLLNPGTNSGYTRMLLFTCGAVIPVSFMLMAVAGRDRLPELVARVHQAVGTGPVSVLVFIGLALVGLLLPLGFLVAGWKILGLRFGLLFVLYLVPVIMRLVQAKAAAAVIAGVAQVMLFMGAALVMMGIVYLVDRFSFSLDIQARHLLAVWPGVGQPERVFVMICVFALGNQLVEFIHALVAVLGRG